ncbi:ABC transporter substrate-binding protein [Bacillus cihuensis]|uniref:ABC transporter substrate-binding protein n=1 Tax=Bacillus cihuensis TaxID=1208599 RepID=UPI0004154278|nr:ABC transporter substrate-binding protein [Bacillus cihuensis]
MAKKLKWFMMFSSFLCLFLLGACSNSASQSKNNENESSNNSSEDNTEESGPVEVSFWHAMSGSGQEAIEDVVNDFNESQDKYIVKPEFQGSYEELLPKFRSVGGTKDAPAIVQTYEIGTKYMIDSGYIEPVQSFIDRDNYDINQLEANILNYYKLDDKLYSMPFNSSTPVLLYNKEAFKEAGLDAENPPKTFNEIKEAAAALTKKNGSNTERFGFSMLTYGWFFEELVATQGGLFVNNDNGRSDQATEATFNSEEGLRVFNLLNDLNNAGHFGNFGTNWDDIRAAFQTGKVAMYMDSSAGVTDTIKNAPFDVGVGFIPYADETERQGVVIGGASLWMSKGISEANQEAAWEFMKYLQTPEAQAKWHVATGYFAINPAAYDEQIVKDKWAESPQLKVTVDQLQATIPSVATQGALISVFPEARQQVVTALENLYQGGNPKEELDKAVEATNKAIEVANKTKK